MSRVYLLLRNNRESGPFTINELLQQQLKPSDMLWIEGKSTAWAYLSELELGPVPQEAPISHDEKITSVLPPDEIERKAEELRKKFLSAKPQAVFNRKELVEKALLQPGEEETEEETIDFIDHRKEKHNILSELAMTVVVIALFAGGVYKGRSLFAEKQDKSGLVVTKMVSGDSHTANKVLAIPVETSPAPATDTLVQQQDSAAMAIAKPVIKDPVKKAVPKSLVTVAIPDSNLEAHTSPDKPKEDITPPVSQETVITDNKDQNAESKADSAASAPVEKKKGFLKGLFLKKKKDE